MERDVRPGILTATGVLTVVSLAVIGGAVRGSLPVGALPRLPDAALAAIPTVNVVVSVLAIALIVSGVRAVRRGAVSRHRRRMLGAFGLFVLFLALYLYRVSLVGPTTFAGPGVVRSVVYLPVLAVHIGLAVLCLPLLYYVLLLALSHPVSEVPDTPHPTVGRVATALWLVSFTLGIVVYLLLHVVY